jgi:hypothetical protein
LTEAQALGAVLEQCNVAWAERDRPIEVHGHFPPPRASTSRIQRLNANNATGHCTWGAFFSLGQAHRETYLVVEAELRGPYEEHAPRLAKVMDEPYVLLAAGGLDGGWLESKQTRAASALGRGMRA